MNAHNVINYFAKLNMLIYTFNGRQLQDNYCKFSVYDIFRLLIISYMNLAVSLATPTMFSVIYSFWLIWNIFIYVHVLCYINIYKVLWYVLSYYLHTCSYNLCSERFGYVAMYSDCIAREVVDLLLTRSCCVYISPYI